ncbi:M1 family metallopeptidase [Melghirimyces thermohalophilus]|nr:M1 family metallopeptidase [Melghirimyces thermohalophilus]
MSSRKKAGGLYSIIGNNQYDEPWLDESFATFSAALYDGELFELNVPPHETRTITYLRRCPPSLLTAQRGSMPTIYMIYDYGASTLNDLLPLSGGGGFFLECDG